MSTVAFSAFYDHLLPELKGITTAMVDLHLLHTARDFCERSSAWRFAFELSAVADEDTYDVSAPELRSEVVRPTKLTIDSVLLWDSDWMPGNQGDTPKYDRADPPFALDILNGDLTLLEDEVPTAAGSQNIALVAALKPSFSATTLPDFLKFQHLEALRCGTLARLMQMGGKPWTDRPLATKYDSDYARLVQIAATAAQRGNTRAPLRSRKWG